MEGIAILAAIAVFFWVVSNDPLSIDWDDEDDEIKEWK